MTDILISLALVLGFAKSLEFIYPLQIKEYRFDRFVSHVKEKGFLKTLYATQPHLPAKSFRNLLIIVANLLLFSVLGFGAVYTQPPVIIITIFIVLAPFLGFSVTSITVILTGIFSSIKRRILIKKAKNKVKGSNAIFIGITGSYGKTTTKEFLHHILSKRYRVEKTEGTVNTDIGIAISVLKNLNADTQFYITEIGAYKKGEIAKACEIIHPRYAILTAIGNQHLSLFGSLNNLIKAKMELIHCIPPDGTAYINRDIRQYKDIVKELPQNIVSYSIKQNATISLKTFTKINGKTKVIIYYNKKTFAVTPNLFGDYKISNLLPCIALAYDLGLTKEEIEKAVNSLPDIANKLSRHKGIGGSLVISDAGNSNVDGFLAAIDTVAQLPQEKKIIVSKGIIELGKDKKDSYTKILSKLNEPDISLYTTDKLFKELDIRSKVYLFESDEQILKKVKKLADENTLIVIEGKFKPDFINSLIQN